MMDRDIEKTLELLREAHREPIAEAHYVAVRARVLSQLAVRRPWWGKWGYGLGLVAAALLLAAFWPRHNPVGQTLPAANRPVEQAWQEQRPPLERTAGRRKRLPHRTAYRVVGPPAPQHLVVKLVTNDPDVVIYWFSGE